MLFNEEVKILLAESFIKAEFLVPFPVYNLTLSPAIFNLIQKLSEAWNTTSLFCKLDFSTNFNKNDTSFSVDWLIHQVEHEITMAKLDISNLHKETSEFLTPPVNKDELSRPRRAAPIAALAVGAIGPFGGGILMGQSEGCGLKGIFGSCQDRAKVNAQNIANLADFADELALDVHRLRTDSNEKFFMVSKELQAIKQAQNEMLEIQNQNWNIIEQQFEIFARNIHILRDCTQMLYSRQQINFNYDSVSSLLALAYANVKSYRAAIYGFRLNLMSSIPTLLHKQLPMSLVSKEALQIILQAVVMDPSFSENRLSLAIPKTEILSYYEAALLSDVVTIHEGILMTLASKQTVLSVYKAHPVPMPQPEPNVALVWKLEADFLAISEDRMETTPLTTDQLSKCLGSSRYRICYESMATEIAYSSCLATLFFKSPIDALGVCETEKVFLPVREQAKNLGFGIWLVTSANDGYTLTESNILSNRASDMQKFKGCRVCLITLKCGKQIMGSNIKIRSDLSSCQNLPAVKVNVKLPDPLQNLISSLPNIEDMPYYNAKIDASIDMLREV